MSFWQTLQARHVDAKAGMLTFAPKLTTGRFGPRLSSNRTSFCKALFVPRSIVCREQCHLRGRQEPPHGGASRANLPMCGTHASLDWVMVQQPRRNGSGHVPAGTPRCVRMLTRVGSDQDMASASRLKGWPDFSIACMMTASLRATAMAARLKPILSRSFNPQVLSALSALVRVRTTVAAS